MIKWSKVYFLVSDNSFSQIFYNCFNKDYRVNIIGLLH